MALIISPPSNSKPHQFSPLRRSTSRPEQAVNFGHHFSKAKTLLPNTKFSTHLQNNNANRSTVPGIVSAALAAEAEPEQEPKAANCKRILLSDVVVKRQSRVFFGRKWNSRDIGTACVVLAIHGLCLFAPFQFSWGAVLVAMALYVVTGLFGITLSFHRNLSHRSFKLPKWLEYLFAYCGSLALQVGRISLWIWTRNSGFCLVFWWFCFFFLVCRGAQLTGWAHIGTTTSFVILRETHIAQLKDFGIVIWVGYLIPILWWKGYEYLSLSHLITG